MRIVFHHNVTPDNLPDTTIHFQRASQLSHILRVFGDIRYGAYSADLCDDESNLVMVLGITSDGGWKIDTDAMEKIAKEERLV